MSKLAIIQCADTGPLESLVVMLNSIGYECAVPNEAIQVSLRREGCDTVLKIKDLVNHWGYENPFPIREAQLYEMSRPNVLYIDVKAHRNGPKVWKWRPHLEGRTLWYRINGGQPEHVVTDRGDHGDEVNPPCPVLTPNQWYKKDYFDSACDAYAFWPPFNRIEEYSAPRTTQYSEPICLIHNLVGWGYNRLVEPFKRLFGLKMYGNGSPDGLINHSRTKIKLRNALAYVHLKSSDAPGYALYEALSAKCPIVCTRRLIWRCKMQDLLIPGKTCLVFDRETHEGLSREDVKNCCDEVSLHLHSLKDPEYNQLIGEAGYNRLKEVMWSPNKETDVTSLRMFMEKNFG